MNIKETILIWWSWFWRNLVIFISFFVLLFSIGKIILKTTGYNVIHDSPRLLSNYVLLIVIFIIYVLLSVYALKISILKVKGAEIGFKNAISIWWAWVWRLIPSIVSLFAIKFYLGFHRFVVVIGTTRSPSTGRVVPLRGLHVNVYNLEAMPVNLIILFLCIWFLKIAIQKYHIRNT